MEIQNITWPSKDNLDYFIAFWTVIGIIFGAFYWLIKKIIELLFPKLLKNSHEAKTQKAINELTKALNKNTQALEKGSNQTNREASEETVRSLTKQKQIKKAEPRIKKAIEQMALGNTAEAEKIFEQVAESKKNHIVEASEAYLHIGILSHTHDVNKAKKALERSVELNPNNIEALNLLGRTYLKQSQYEKAINIFCQAVRISIRRKDTLAKCQNMGNIALVLQMQNDQGKNEIAIKIHKKIINSYQGIGYELGIAKAYGNIGIIYKNMGKEYYDLALESHKTSFYKNRKLENKQGMAASIMNIGIIHDLKEKYIDAIIYYDSAMIIARTENDVEGIASNHINIGIVYINLEEYKKAEEEISKALTISKDHSLLRHEALCYAYLGKIQKNSENHEKAKELWTIAVKIFEEIGMKSAAAPWKKAIDEI